MTIITQWPKNKAPLFFKDTIDRDNLLDAASDKNCPLHTPCSPGRKLDTFLGSISNASEVLVHVRQGGCDKILSTTNQHFHGSKRGTDEAILDSFAFLIEL